MVTVTGRPSKGAGSISSMSRYSAPSSTSQTATTQTTSPQTQTSSKTPINTSPALNPDVRAERTAANYAAGVVSSQSPTGRVSGAGSSSVALGGFMPSQYTSSSKDGVVTTPARSSADYGNRFSSTGGASFVGSSKYGSARDQKGLDAQKQAEYGRSPQARTDDRNRYLSNIQNKQALAQKVKSPAFNVKTRGEFNKQLSGPLVTQPAINRLLSGATTTKKTSTVKIGGKEVTTTILTPSNSAYLSSTPKAGSIYQETAHTYEYQVTQGPQPRAPETALQKGVRVYSEQVITPIGGTVAKGAKTVYGAAESKAAVVTKLLPSSANLKTKAQTFFDTADQRADYFSQAATTKYGAYAEPITKGITKTGDTAAIGIGMGLGYYEGVRTKPLKTLAYTAAGFVSPYVLAGAGKATVAVVGATTAVKVATAAKVVGTGLATVYGGSIAYKASQASKQETGTKRLIQGGEVIGEKLGTEIVPLITGATAGTALKAKTISAKITADKPATTHRTSKGITSKSRTTQTTTVKVGTTTYKAKSIARSKSTYYGKTQVSIGKGNIKTDILKDATGKGNYKHQQTITQKTAQKSTFNDDGTINIKLGVTTGKKGSVYDLEATKILEVKPTTSGLTVTTNKVSKVYLPKDKLTYSYTGTKYTANVKTGKTTATDSVKGLSARTSGVEILKTPVTGKNKNTRILSIENWISTSKSTKLPNQKLDAAKTKAIKGANLLIASKKAQITGIRGETSSIGTFDYTFKPSVTPTKIFNPQQPNSIKVMPTIKQAPPTVTPSQMALKPIVRAARFDFFATTLPKAIGGALLVYGATSGAKTIFTAASNYQTTTPTKNIMINSALSPSKTTSTTKSIIDSITEPKTITKTGAETITETTTETIYKPFVETPTPTIFTPPTFPFNEIPPPDKPPLLPYASTPPSGGWQSFNFEKRKKGKQTKKYTPTAYAAVFEIKGKASKAGTKTGIGVRPISTKQPKKIRFKI